MSIYGTPGSGQPEDPQQRPASGPPAGEYPPPPPGEYPPPPNTGYPPPPPAPEWSQPPQPPAPGWSQPQQPPAPEWSQSPPQQQPEWSQPPQPPAPEWGPPPQQQSNTGYPPPAPEWGPPPTSGGPQQPPYPGGPEQPQSGPPAPPYGPPGAPLSAPGAPYGPPAGPPPKKGNTAKIIIIAAIVAVLLLCTCGGVAAWWIYDQASNIADENGPSISAPSPTSSRPGLDLPSPGLTGSTDSYSKGDCVVNDGTDSDPELRKVPCGPNTYEVLSRIPFTIEEERCESDAIFGSPETDVTYVHDNSLDVADYVLCLKRR
ncbi:LppU/SCO3897 family protein [Plantactinospora sp. CA-290183]|uniref:LppU/SCO3897 family protein n=1 Tax=Plantactinospora sp. CA-290183 TaxID=3240006 RepID=UPI003D8EDB44